MRFPRGLRIGLMLTPALVVVFVLFAGGFVLAFLQSLDYFPLIGLKHFNLNAYRQTFDDPEFRSSLYLTLRIAILSTAISAILAVLASLMLRATRRGRRLLTFLFELNLPIPHLVGAVSLLFLLSSTGLVSRVTHAVGVTSGPSSFPRLVNDPWGIGIMSEYVWKEVPFVGVIVLATLVSGVLEFEDVARSLGARRWQRFRYVIVPHITPAVVSASILVFAFSFGAYEVPYLLGQSYPLMLPVLAYEDYTAINLSSQPEALAIATIIAIIVGLLVIAYMWVTSRYIRS